MNKKFWLVNIWQNKVCLDLWSVNHFLSGIVLGFFSMMLALNFWPSLILVIIVVVAWEIYEVVRSETRERICNKFFDVFLGVSGFIVSRTIDFTDTFFAVIILVFILLELWGLYGYKIRKSSSFENN